MIRTLFTIKKNGLVFSIRVIARAKKNSVGDIFIDNNNTLRLKIYTTSVPENGRANCAILKLLSRAWRINKDQIEIIHGLKQRDKILFLKGSPDKLMALLGKYI